MIFYCVLGVVSLAATVYFVRQWLDWRRDPIDKLDPLPDEWMPGRIVEKKL